MQEILEEIKELQFKKRGCMPNPRAQARLVVTWEIDLTWHGWLAVVGRIGDVAIVVDSSARRQRCL